MIKKRNPQDMSYLIDQHRAKLLTALARIQDDLKDRLKRISKALDTNREYLRELIEGSSGGGEDLKPVLALLRELRECRFEALMIWPSLAPGIKITAAKKPWTLGFPAVVIPSYSLNHDFHIHWISVSAVSRNGEYELALYNGNRLLAQALFSRGSSAGTIAPVGVTTDYCNCALEVKAELASSNNKEDWATIKLKYHPKNK